MYNEEDYLLLSGIQHFVFCRRQWALIHIEQQWEENYRTVDGKIMHRNAHDGKLREKRGDVIIAKAMAVASSEMGISGECDVVEFARNGQGVALYGFEGKYSVTPVEYKRGEPKENDSDIMQLTAQAMCLEEMLCCEIPYGYIYYGEKRRRTKVIFSEELRERTRDTVKEMHLLYDKRYTPKVKRNRACNACSLKHICLPMICSSKRASDYVDKKLNEDGEQSEETTEYTIRYNS